MAHRSFGTVRAAEEREPVTFDFGMYAEATFTVVPDPTLGDTFDLYDMPDGLPADDVGVVQLHAKFIRRMLAVEDRARFDAVLYRIPSTEAHIVLEAAQWIAEQVTGFPTTPPTISSGGRQTTGRSSKRKRGGGARSKP